jgi:hypothetical protein
MSSSDVSTETPGDDKLSTDVSATAVPEANGDMSSGDDKLSTDVLEVVPTTNDDMSSSDVSTETPDDGKLSADATAAAVPEANRDMSSSNDKLTTDVLAAGVLIANGDMLSSDVSTETPADDELSTDATAAAVPEAKGDMSSGDDSTTATDDISPCDTSPTTNEGPTTTLSNEAQEEPTSPEKSDDVIAVGPESSSAEASSSPKTGYACPVPELSIAGLLEACAAQAEEESPPPGKSDDLIAVDPESSSGEVPESCPDPEHSHTDLPANPPEAALAEAAGDAGPAAADSCDAASTLETDPVSDAALPAHQETIEELVDDAEHVSATAALTAGCSASEVEKKNGATETVASESIEEAMSADVASSSVETSASEVAVEANCATAAPSSESVTAVRSMSVEASSASMTCRTKAMRHEDGGRSSKSFKMFGLEFAPVYIPFERRLQTLAVFTW